jgi:monofunctional biosynthetic peptidoglycan transglycosylase
MPFTVPEVSWWERWLASDAFSLRGGLSRLIRAWPWIVGWALLFLSGVVALHLYLNSDDVTVQIEHRLRRELTDRGIEYRLGSVEVDWWGRVTLRDFALLGPAARPILKASALRIRPSYHALLDGRVQAASVRLEDPELFPGPGGEALREFWSALKSRGTPRVRSEDMGRVGEFPVIRVQHAVVHLEKGGYVPEPLDLGPLDAELMLRRDVLHHEIDARFSFPQGGEARTSVQWGESEALRAEVSISDVRPSLVPSPLLERLPVHLEDGVGSLKLHLEAPPGFRTGTLMFNARARDGVVSGERLASERVGPLNFGAHGTLRWDRGHRKVRLDEGVATVGADDEVKVGFDAEGSWAAPLPFHVDVHVDKVSYQAALDALPFQVTPGPEAPVLEGPISAQMSLQGPLRDPEAWELSVNLDLTRLKENAKRSPSKLKGPFAYLPREMHGPVHEVWVGEKNPNFTPIAQLPLYVYRAVTASEDGGFFGHHGFDFQEMKNSFVSVAEEKRFRGASTITQQLAKNLFLSRERTYARKVQEALVTLALEGSLSKQRILEIYLNIIEWGPGVYGIGEAAQHYFGKDARNLTVTEAAFLATIIPNPIAYHVYFTRGDLTENWRTRVRNLIGRMHEQGVLTDLEYLQAEDAPLQFRTPEGRKTAMPGSRRVDRAPQPWKPLGLPLPADSMEEER